MADPVSLPYPGSIVPWHPGLRIQKVTGASGRSPVSLGLKMTVCGGCTSIKKVMQNMALAESWEMSSFMFLPIALFRETSARVFPGSLVFRRLDFLWQATLEMLLDPLV